MRFVIAGYGHSRSGNWMGGVGRVGCGDGGFGGGGGGHSNSGGGGGGYSGGAGSSNYAGGGGGSYCTSQYSFNTIKLDSTVLF